MAKKSAPKKAAKKSAPKKAAAKKAAKKSSPKTETREEKVKELLALAANRRLLAEEKKNISERKKKKDISIVSHLDLNNEMKHKDFPEFLRENHEENNSKINR